MKSVKEDNIVLIDLILKAKGDRSYRQYAQDAGVSYASISRILKGDYVPSAKTLKRLTSEEANPQGGVTYDDLMIAAGFQSDQQLYFDDIVENYMAADITDVLVTDEKKSQSDSKYNVLVETNFVSDESSYERMRRLAMHYRIMTQKFEAIGKGIIYKAAIENGIEVKKGNGSSANHSGKLFDLDIIVKNKSIKAWHFDFIVFRDDLLRLMKQQIVEKHIARLVMLAPDSKRKISLVLKDRAMFEAIKEYSGKMSYRGELSAILIDEESMEVADEIYLTHYDEGDISREIYLTAIQEGIGENKNKNT